MDGQEFKTLVKFECPCGFRYELPCIQVAENKMLVNTDGVCPQCKGTEAVLKKVSVEV